MKNQIKFLAAIFMMVAVVAQAHEGMWLPMMVKQKNYQEMVENGLKLTAEELYSINNSSLKDAVVSLGGFCTAELISGQGLLLTNHHCAYGQIQKHSSEENDYLTNGFWAESFEKELPNEGLFVRFLVRMEDVTNKIVSELTDDMKESEREEKAREIGAKLEKEAMEGNDYKAEVKSFFHGNEFYLMVYETYNDVRLVGAPPSSIGKYGGDTDNWMWTRHTGDFSLLRIYADSDGKPAKYSKDNVPLKPKHFFPVSIDGVDEGDFTMVFGFPGSTDRFLSSYGVKQAIEKHNPAIVEIRTEKLAIMKEEMELSDATRIKLATKYAQTSNYWKYFQGQTAQLKRNGVYERKKDLEDNFMSWVNKNPARKAKYGETLNLLEQAYKETDPSVVPELYMREAGLTGPMMPLFVFRNSRLFSSFFDMEVELKIQLKEATSKEEKAELKQKFAQRREALKQRILDAAEKHFKDYDAYTDQRLIGKLWQMYHDNVDAEYHPDFFKYVAKKHKGDFESYAQKLFDKSILVDKKRLEDFLDKPKKKKLEKDLGYIASMEFAEMYIASISGAGEADEKMTRGYRLLTAGLREMQPEKLFYPDANSTMRITWGVVGSYQPADAITYHHYTTIDGVFEKEDPNNKEFTIPERLRTLYENKDFGQYANDKGELVVNFIHNTDITGGNSGSPVLNAKGELIGCAFDGNWEAMSGDISFEEKVQRTISVDARYILFVIDKYAGAKRLIEEMTIVKSDKEVKEEADKAASN